MNGRTLYHRLYARWVRARLRWSVSPPVFFARKRYWLTSVAVLVLIVGAVASVLAWRSHVERVERELDAQALAGATSVVNAYCDAIIKGACQFFCVWGLEVGGDSVGVGGGELGEGLFPVGGGVSLDEAGVSCSFVGGFASVCEALGGAFVFDVADGEP